MYKSSPTLRAGLVLAGAFLASAPAMAADTEAPAEALKADGMIVTRDPETGAMRAATAAEVAAMNAAGNGGSKSSSKTNKKVSIEPQAVRLPDGTLMLRTPDDMVSYTVAQRRADGSLSKSCIDGGAAAEQAVRDLSKTAPASTQAVEK